MELSGGKDTLNTLLEYDVVDEAEEYPIIELEQYYLDSCPLRFIHPFSLPDDRDYVKQGDLYPEFIYHV